MLEDLNARDFIHDTKLLLKCATDEEFANKIGEKKATVDKWIQRKKIPLAKKIFIEKLIDDMPRDQHVVDFYKDLENSATSSPINNIMQIPIIEAKASAGSGIEQYEVETRGQIMIDKMLFKILPNLNNVRAIAVSGDSMTPTLQDGDYVVIEESMRFSGDGIYVLQYDGVLLVKRLQADLDGIEILSDNQKYKARTYNPNDDQRSFHIVGKVILHIQR